MKSTNHLPERVLLERLVVRLARWGIRRKTGHTMQAPLSGQRAIRRATPRALAAAEFAEGSMGPKVRAACAFVEQTGGIAAIGSIADVERLLKKETGTVVSLDARGLEVVGTA